MKSSNHPDSSPEYSPHLHKISVQKIIMRVQLKRLEGSTQSLALGTAVPNWYGLRARSQFLEWFNFFFDKYGFDFLPGILERKIFLCVILHHRLQLGVGEVTLACKRDVDFSLSGVFRILNPLL